MIAYFLHVFMDIFIINNTELFGHIYTFVCLFLCREYLNQTIMDTKYCLIRTQAGRLGCGHYCQKPEDIG